MLDITLLTRGSPEQLSGGHLYHRRMVDAAAGHGARLAIRTVRAGRYPFAGAGDVVLIDSLAATAVAPWLLTGRGRGVGLAAIVHQEPGGVDHSRLRTAIQRRLDALVYRRCAIVLAVSEHVAKQVRACGVPGDRIRVASPGRDLPVACAAGPQRDVRDGRRLAVLCVANWYANKGVLDVLEAVARLPGDAVTLHLVGRDDVDPAHTQRIRARLAEPDLDGRVVVHGALGVDDLAGLYAAADVFALASRSEAYGTVYAEALTAGLPIVGWRSGNLPNMIDDDLHGRLVAPGDVAGFARALQQLTDEAYRSRLAAAALARGAELPTWADTARVFFGALSRLAPGPG